MKNNKSDIVRFVLLIIVTCILLTVLIILTVRSEENQRIADLASYLESDPIISIDGTIVDLNLINLQWYTKYYYDENKNILYLSH